MRMYSYTRDELEDFADFIKTATVDGLINSKLVDEDAGDNWCRTHTLLARGKSIFRTISKLWKDEAESSGHHWVVVKRI